MGGLGDDEQSQVRLDESGCYLPLCLALSKNKLCTMPHDFAARFHLTRVSSVGVYFDEISSCRHADWQHRRCRRQSDSW